MKSYSVYLTKSLKFIRIDNKLRTENKAYTLFSIG